MGCPAERTYNKDLSIPHDFFVFQVRRGKLRGDPTLLIERAKTRAVHWDVEQLADTLLEAVDE